MHRNAILEQISFVMTTEISVGKLHGFTMKRALSRQQSLSGEPPAVQRQIVSAQGQETGNQNGNQNGKENGNQNDQNTDSSDDSSE